MPLFFDVPGQRRTTGEEPGSGGRRRGIRPRGSATEARQSAPRPPSGNGDVRPRRGHLDHERLDLGRCPRHRHHGERCAVRYCSRGPGVCIVHPDREQGRRSHRAQEGVCARIARLRGGGSGDGTRPEPDDHHHLLGHRRRPWRVTPAASDAVADPRELRRCRATQGLRTGRCGCGHRRSCRSARRWLHHDVSVVENRLLTRGRDHTDRPLGNTPRQRRGVHRTTSNRRRGCFPLGHRDGRPRARHSGVAGGW